MGYFHAAFVLLRTPKNGQLWLLDFWQASRRSPAYPFIEGDEIGGLWKLPSDHAIDDYDTLGHILMGSNGYGGGWLRLTWAIARLLAQPVYFFAADDEETDMAAHAEADGIMRIGCRMDRCELRFADRRWTVTPLTFSEEAYREVWSVEALRRAASLPGVEVTPPTRIEDGNIFYKFPVSEWPQEAGNPETVLGLGTWDPFENFPQDFRAVFER